MSNTSTTPCRRNTATPIEATLRVQQTLNNIATNAAKPISPLPTSSSKYRLLDRIFVSQLPAPSLSPYKKRKLSGPQPRIGELLTNSNAALQRFGRETVASRVTTGTGPRLYHRLRSPLAFEGTTPSAICAS